MSLIVLLGISFCAFTQERWELYQVENERAAPARIATVQAGDVSTPAVSPKERYLAFECNSTRIGIQALGTNSSPALLQGTTFGEISASPAWNPATLDLLFLRCRFKDNSEQCEIVSIHPETPNQEPTVVVGERPWGTFSVSPNGAELVYSAIQPDGPDKNPAVFLALVSRTLATGIERQLTSGTCHDIDPAWSPDGKWLAWSSDRTGQYQIWIMSAEGRDPRQLTKSEGPKSNPSWSPNGHEILFTQATDGRYSMAIATVATGTIRSFLPFGEASTTPLRNGSWR